MKFDTVITGGTLVSAAETITADIGIAGGRIAALGLGLPTAGAEDYAFHMICTDLPDDRLPDITSRTRGCWNGGYSRT